MVSGLSRPFHRLVRQKDGHTGKFARHTFDAHTVSVPESVLESFIYAGNAHLLEKAGAGGSIPGQEGLYGLFVHPDSVVCDIDAYISVFRLVQMDVDMPAGTFGLNAVENGILKYRLESEAQDLVFQQPGIPPP